MPSLDDVYDQHPQSANELIRRVTGNGVSFSSIREQHLAKHAIPYATDQNHPGGTHFVERLALLADIDAAAVVADLGAGIGGAARWLAHSTGCQVIAIELNRSRCEQARYLNVLTQLDHLVDVRCADYTTYEIGNQRIDVVWGQASWIHCDELGQLFRNWSPQLRSTGYFAFEDSYLKRVPAGEECLLIDELQQLWAAKIPSERDWLNYVANIGFKAKLIEDLTDTYRREFELQIDSARKAESGTLPETEIRGWQIATELVDRGLLGYLRIVARRS